MKSIDYLPVATAARAHIMILGQGRRGSEPAVTYTMPHTETSDGNEGEWLVFVFRRMATDGAPTQQVLEITQLDTPSELEADVTGVVALVHRSLLDQWWGADANCAPIAPGSYFLPRALEALVGAIDCADPATPGQSLLAQAKIQVLICEAMEAWKGGGLTPASAAGAVDREARQKMTQVRLMIEGQYAEKLTITSLARACGIGRVRLIRDFRLVFGQTVAECLTEQRLSAAAGALLATNQPISKIAFNTGYHSNAAFTRAFARYHGMAPTLYRSQEGRGADKLSRMVAA